MSPRPRLTLLADDPERLRRRVVMASIDEPDLTVGRLLSEHRALCGEPLSETHLSVPVRDVRIDVTALRPDVPCYVPPGLRLGPDTSQPDPATGDGAAGGGTAGDGTAGDGTAGDGTAGGVDPDVDLDRHPETITDREAVILAHRADIERAASYLEGGLSVLARCDKVLVSHLCVEIAARTGRPTRMLRAQSAGDTPSGPLPGLGGSRRNELLDQLLAAVTSARTGELIVVPHLDLLAGGNDSTLSAEAREVADALYEQADCVLLGFVDPSLSLPEVLASRFAVRLAIDILPRVVRTSRGHAPIGRALVTQQEADLFGGFDEVGLYKHIAGLNAVRLRHGLRFAAHQYERPADGAAADGAGGRKPQFRQLVAELQTFKAKTSTSFEVPNVSFEAIGGYQDVKDELHEALSIINGVGDLPEHLRTELVPAGFIFHGPPGTGKTLFAKAVATQLGATILVVSGPEITDKYVGESERKIRELFAEARRNAPSVVVFDEFDSIAVRRSGNDDGGSRAGNAIVAQLLTELDGFRPEVPVLIIGTTNRLDLIDEALLRPSRFRPIQIGLPEIDARWEIAAYHARHFGVEVMDELLDKIAAATEQFSGDDIRSLFRDARARQLVRGEVADDFRIGQLVGELRQARQERAAQRTGGPPTAHAAGGRRVRVSEASMGGVVLRRRQMLPPRTPAATEGGVDDSSVEAGRRQP